MNEPFINIVNYLRLLSRQHNDIKAFGIGEVYELNDFDNFQFPLLWLELPFESTFTDILDPIKLRIDFKIHIFTNIVYDKNTNPVQVTESMIQKSTNQISYTNLALQDELVNNAFKLLTQICTRFVRDVNESSVIINIDNNLENIPMVIESISLVNQSRATNKDLYQSTASISLVIENSYLCPIDTYFDYDVQ